MTTENNTQQVIVAKKESGTVTALTVLSLILGTIGLLGSFIPCLGALAIYLAIPALICAGIAFFMAKKKDISIGLPVTAIVICGLAVIISALQIMALNKSVDAINDANIELNKQLEENKANETKTIDETKEQ